MVAMVQIKRTYQLSASKASINPFGITKADVVAPTNGLNV